MSTKLLRDQTYDNKKQKSFPSNYYLNNPPKTFILDRLLQYNYKRNFVIRILYVTLSKIFNAEAAQYDYINILICFLLWPNCLNQECQTHGPQANLNRPSKWFLINFGSIATLDNTHPTTANKSLFL